MLTKEELVKLVDELVADGTITEEDKARYAQAIESQSLEDAASLIQNDLNKKLYETDEAILDNVADASAKLKQAAQESGDQELISAAGEMDSELGKVVDEIDKEVDQMDKDEAEISAIAQDIEKEAEGAA